jgi:glycosyltransferase involved in cell wall biosynthesis
MIRPTWGKLVVASDIDGIPEAFSVAAYGQLIKRGSLDALAAAMIEWCGKAPLDLATRSDLHKRVAERFSLERAARDLSDVYESLISGQKHGNPRQGVFCL